MTAAVAAAVFVPPEIAAGAVTQPGAVQAGYGVSLTDLSAFHQSLAGAPGRLEARAAASSGETMKALFRPLEHARAAMAAGTNLTPGEMVMLTVRCQEFLFHSQLTANAANRTSDGLQQLFRQQS
jgi:hypothetical protein